MEDLWDNENPCKKMKVEYNEHCQPVGAYASKLANIIGTRAKGTVLSLAHENWADVENKDDVWTDTLRLFDLDECLKSYVLQSAHKKWKDFKNRLKKKYFDPEMSLKQLMKLHQTKDFDKRVSKSDWRWLIKFWKSEKGQARSARGVANRAKMGSAHTIGSSSLANVAYALEQKKGRKVGRAEVYKAAYTRKDGTPQPAQEETLRKIDERISQEPDFQDKPLAEGDLLHNLIGNKNRGTIVGIGMGPSPSSLSLPGVKKTTCASLQFEREARQRAESEAQALREQMEHLRNENAQCKEEIQQVRNENAEFKEEMQRKMADQIAEFKAMMANSHGKQKNPNISNEDRETSSASDNIQLDNNDPSRRSNVRRHVHKRLDQDRNLSHRNNIKAQGENIKAPKRAVPYTKAQSKYKGLTKPCKVVATTNSTGGEEVYLKAIARPYDRIARATIESKNPSELVGDTVLGGQCYKVVVDSIMREDAELFRPHRNMKCICDAIGHSIAWPSILVEQVTPLSSRHHGQVIEREHGEVIRSGGRIRLAAQGS